MSQILYGYKMDSGNVVIDSKAAEKVISLFESYIKCSNLTEAAKIAGINKTRSSIGNMLKNRRYLGDAYYPRIIADELFQKVENIRLDKARIRRKCIEDESEEINE